MNNVLIAIYLFLIWLTLVTFGAVVGGVAGYLDCNGAATGAIVMTVLVVLLYLYMWYKGEFRDV